RHFGQPRVDIALGYPAQHRVGIPGRSGAGHQPDQVDGGRDRARGRHPHAEQLVRAEPQQVEQGRIDLRQRAVHAGGEHHVPGAAAAQCAVAELDRECGVPAGDTGLPQDRRQRQIGVRVALVDVSKQVIGRAPGRVGGHRALPSRTSPAPRRPARTAGLALRAGGPGGAHSNRSPDWIRTPRTQSNARIRRLPWGWTVPNRTGAVPVPTRTARLSTKSSPGASDGPAGAGSSGRTGSSFTRLPRNVVQAPGSGMHARIWRSTYIAAVIQAPRPSSTVSLCAYEIPSAGCGTGTSYPASMPSRVATSSRAPVFDSRSSRSPLVSLGLIGSLTTPYPAPVSSPASFWKVHAPV